MSNQRYDLRGVSASKEDVHNAIRNCHSPAAVVLSHPSYYGTYSDLRAIVDVAHQAGVAVIVDEAHGAQLAFTEQQGIPSSLSAAATPKKAAH